MEVRTGCETALQKIMNIRRNYTMARRGGFPGGMPGNMTNLMKQAQRMQRQMEEKTDRKSVV